MTASVELMRCGDVSVMTNGVTWTLPRELPFAHDGFGQDAEWVAANFTNATEIAAAGGYAAWVDAQVGEGLTNNADFKLRHGNNYKRGDAMTKAIALTLLLSAALPLTAQYDSIGGRRSCWSRFQPMT